MMAFSPHVRPGEGRDPEPLAFDTGQRGCCNDSLPLAGRVGEGVSEQGLRVWYPQPRPAIERARSYPARGGEQKGASPCPA